MGLAGAAAACFEGGYVLQAYEARRAPTDRALRASLFAYLARRPRWLVAAGLLTLGWPLQVGALRLAPLTVVQPTLSLGLLLLLAFAARWLHERVGVREIAGVLGIAAGTAVIAWGSPEHTDSHGDAVQLALALAPLGALTLAKANGYKTLALLAEDTAFPKAVSAEVGKMAGEYGLKIVFDETYPKGSSDFSALLTKVKQIAPDVLFANSYLPDSQGILRQCHELGIEAKMFAVAVGAAEPEFRNLGPSAEYVFGATQWAATMPRTGNPAFVEAYQRKFNRAPDYHSAANYASMQVLEAAVKQVGSLDQDKLAAAISKLKLDTVYGRFEVDPRGVQIGFVSALLQWQKGKQVLVWPDDVAKGKPILPTPPWSQRQ